ncbi:MAG: hypothetical protein II999_07020 [Bacteroidaceae bacterium]|nr:hypothetical protein [Bacteroidaceae bacterium]
MKLNNLLYALALVLCFTSCGTITKDQSFSAGRISLEMNMDDLVCLGETEISAEYNTVLGVFTKLERINGEAYNPGEPKKKLNIPGQKFTLNGTGMELAAYKLAEEFPQAVYFQIVYESTVKDRMFLGSVTKKTAKVRAYRLK